MWVYACVSSVVFVATAAAVAVGGVVSVSVIGIGIAIGIGITVVVVPVGSLSVFVMYFGHCAVPNYDPSHPFRVKKNGVLSPNRNNPPIPARLDPALSILPLRSLSMGLQARIIEHYMTLYCTAVRFSCTAQHVLAASPHTDIAAARNMSTLSIFSPLLLGRLQRTSGLTFLGSVLGSYNTLLRAIVICNSQTLHRHQI